MTKHTFILSSAGLKNIILSSEYLTFYQNSFDEELNQFSFIIGTKEIKMNRFFAQFLSPIVSHIHRSDPTVNSIFLNDILRSIQKNSFFLINENKIIKNEQRFSNFEELFTDEIIEIIKNISSGYEVEIDEKISINLRIISILIGNEEIYKQINTIYPFTMDESEINFEYIVELLRFLHNYFEDKQIIDFISSHFYMINHSILLKLPKSIIYSIISNPKLIIENEDSLLDFINQVFANNNCTNTEDDKFNNIFIFYENIEFSQLNDTTFSQFILNLDYTQITNILWKKLCKCFPLNYSSTNQPSDEVRLTRYFQFHEYHELLYDSFFDSQFSGIIHYFTEKCHGNVHNKGIISVTASSYLNYFHFPKFVVNLDDTKNYYQSATNDKDAWICYDFKEFKVKPTHYSIRSRHDANDVNGSPCNWCIEGSNNNKEWVVLDTRKEETSLKYANSSNVFEIQRKLGKDEFYRYLRMRKTGVDTAGNNYFTISALEYFGAFV